MEKMKYVVKPEYRDLWSDDPDWNGATDEEEIMRLSKEWEKPLSVMLEMVEEG